jgi:hypothetical protein
MQMAILTHDVTQRAHKFLTESPNHGQIFSNMEEFNLAKLRDSSQNSIMNKSRDLTRWFDANVHSPSRDGWYDCKECQSRHYFCDGKWYRNADSLRIAGSMHVYAMHWRGLAQGPALEASRLNPKGIRVAIEDMCVSSATHLYEDQTDLMPARRKREKGWQGLPAALIEDVKASLAEVKAGRKAAYRFGVNIEAPEDLPLQERNLDFP